MLRWNRNNTPTMENNMNFLILIAIPVIAATVGWMFGRDNVDPNSTAGAAYYNTAKDD